MDDAQCPTCFLPCMIGSRAGSLHAVVHGGTVMHCRASMHTGLLCVRVLLDDLRLLAAIHAVAVHTPRGGLKSLASAPPRAWPRPKPACAAGPMPRPAAMKPPRPAAAAGAAPVSTCTYACRLAWCLANKCCQRAPRRHVGVAPPAWLTITQIRLNQGKQHGWADPAKGLVACAVQLRGLGLPRGRGSSRLISTDTEATGHRLAYLAVLHRPAHQPVPACIANEASSLSATLGQTTFYVMMPSDS